MSFIVLALTLALSLDQARGAAPPASSVRSQLDAYEAAATRRGAQDPAALAAVARAAIERARQSSEFRTWSEACASDAIPDGAECGKRLWAALNDRAQPITLRAEAAAALIQRRDRDAPPALVELVKGLDAKALAPLAPILALLPEREAVPLLVRLSQSPDAGHQAAACRSLGRFDSPDARLALASVVAGNPPGTTTWLLCNVARARLREPDAQGSLSGYIHELQGDDRMYATSVMVDIGHESAGLVLTDLTHRGDHRVRVGAARLLVGQDPDAAAAVAEGAVADPDADVRALAIEVLQAANREPSRAVRRLMLDPDGIVQVRAAEACLAWARRQRIH